MASTSKNVFQVKSDAKQIIVNLQQLNNYEGHEDDLENLKNYTEYLLSKLEILPLERFKAKIKNKQKKKLNKNLQKLIKQDCSNNAKEQIVGENFKITNVTISRKPKQKLDHHFKSIKECKRFLQNFELLEQLHLSRSNNPSETYKFALKLRQLKSIWNCLLQEKLQEQTSEDFTIQQQWNEVLFGPHEKTYFHDKPDILDFIRKRQVWDTYINSKYGSSIPVGWVVPPEKVKQQWRSKNI